MNEINVVGIDLAKNVFELAGQNRGGRVVWRKRVRRSKLPATVSQLPPCVIGLEACGGAHFWARQFEAMGHRVRILPAQYVKPYRIGTKNDAHDADAVCEAAARAHVPEVAIKSPDQLALQALHRVRRQLVGQHTALGNCARGLLQEFGIVVRRGHAPLRRALAEALDDVELPEHLRAALQPIRDSLTRLETQIDQLGRRLERVVAQDEQYRRLTQPTGVGPLTATAFATFVGRPESFDNGRQVSAALGLVPAQASSGEREQLLGISKTGDCYVRGLLVHGARSALKAARGKSDPMSRWMCRLAQRRGHNKAVVAIANKNARILWAMMKSGQDFRPERAVAA